MPSFVGAPVENFALGILASAKQALSSAFRVRLHWWMTLLAFPAHADVSGPACVTDGDTLVVNGKGAEIVEVNGAKR